MTAVAEKERSAETLLEAKGYKNVVVTMIDDSVDVIVDAKNLKETDIAGIQDIVKRKMEKMMLFIYKMQMENHYS